LAFASFTLIAHAESFQAANNFTIAAVTSANYNPVLPINLTPETAITDLAWEFQSTNWNQIKQSNYPHGGGWIAFLTLSDGNIADPIGEYNNTNAIFFGRYFLSGSSGIVHEYYCTCDAGAFFKATAYPIPFGSPIPAKMYVN